MATDGDLSGYAKSGEQVLVSRKDQDFDRVCTVVGSSAMSASDGTSDLLWDFREVAEPFRTHSLPASKVEVYLCARSIVELVAKLVSTTGEGSEAESSFRQSIIDSVLQNKNYSQANARELVDRLERLARVLPGISGRLS